MCNACGNVCCGSDMFGGCGCDRCACEECWSDDDDLDDPGDPECVTPQANHMPSPELQAVLRDALAKTDQQ